MVEAELLGRTAELTRLERLVVRAAEGPVAVTLAGEAGIGKTIVWQAAVEAASARNDRLVLTARADEAERDLANVTLTDLLAPAVQAAGTLDRLPRPQADALAAALLLTAPTDPVDPRTLGTAVAGAIRDLASDRPIVLAIDDVQWIDDASRAALTFSLRRLAAPATDTAPVALLTTVRTPARDPLADALPAADSERIELRPVSLGVLHQLLRARLGLVLPRPQLLRLEAASGGNPLLAIELGRELARRDQWPLPGEPLPIPPDIAGLFAERFARLESGDRELLFVAAAASDPTTATVAAALDRDPNDVRGALDRLGSGGQDALGHVDDTGSWRFEHPLIAAAALAAVDAPRRRALHGRLMALAPTTEDRGRHAALAAEGPDADIADLVDAAGQAANARGATVVAATWSEVAADLTPEDEADNLALAARRRLRAARWLANAGDIDRATAILDHALDDLPAGDPRAEALELRAQMAGWTSGEAAVLEFTRQALAEVQDPLLEARILLRMATSANGGTEAIAMADQAATILEAAGAATADPDLLASALIQRSCLAFEAGLGSDDETVERASALLADHPRPGADGAPTSEGLRAHQDLHVWDIDHDRLADGLARLDRELAFARERGHDRPLPIVEYEATLAAAWAGDLRTAEAHAAASKDAATVSDHPEARSAALAASAAVALARGDLRAAIASAEEALSTWGHLGWLALRHRMILGSAALADGRPAEAVSLLGGVLDETVAAGRRETNDGRFAGDLVEAAVASGDLERARATAHLLHGSATIIPRPWIAVMAPRANSLVAAAEGDLDGAAAAIDTALAAASELPMPVEVARTELIAGRIRRRRKERRRAAEHLERAVAILRDVGSMAWLAIGEAELARVGRRTSDAAELTETEDQVARLAARGLTNREVGEAAFLTPKSVEGVLSRVYGKLGIRSRAELGAWLAAQDAGSRTGNPPFPADVGDS